MYKIIVSNILVDPIHSPRHSSGDAVHAHPFPVVRIAADGGVDDALLGADVS